MATTVQANSSTSGSARGVAGLLLCALTGLGVPALAAAVLAAAGQASMGGGAFAGGLWASRWTWLSLGMLGVCGAAMVPLVRYALATGAVGRSRARLRGEAGTAILEFTLVLPIALFLVLVMAQTSLLMVGNLCVHYSAYCAARSAAVQVPLPMSDAESANEVAAPGSSGKLLRMHYAAIYAVTPVSCSHSDYPGGSAGADLADGVEDLLGRYGRPIPVWLDSLDRRMQYAADHTRVYLGDPVEPPLYGPAEDLRVTVEHDFYLSIPYAGRLFARISGTDGVDLDFGAGEYAVTIHATCTLPNEGAQDYIDIEEFPTE